MTRPEDLPAGFADNHALRLGYLRWRIEFGDESMREVLEREERDGFSTLLFDPEPDTLYDVGTEYYGEFICDLDTAARILREQGLTVRGVPGTVSVATRFTNGAQMRWRADA